MRKIAPQLTALLEFDLCVKGSGGLKTDSCKKELRAMLAVARLSFTVVLAHDYEVKPPGLHAKSCRACRFERARDRLDRVSGGKP